MSTDSRNGGAVAPYNSRAILISAKDGKMPLGVLARYFHPCFEAVESATGSGGTQGDNFGCRCTAPTPVLLFGNVPVEVRTKPSGSKIEKIEIM